MNIMESEDWLEQERYFRVLQTLGQLKKNWWWAVVDLNIVANGSTLKEVTDKANEYVETHNLKTRSIFAGYTN